MALIEVFVSSRMTELADERAMLWELIPTLSEGVLRLHPWVFEKNAPASDRSTREVYLQKLRRSALYVGILGNGYGEWTIDEFERATELGIPRHLYVKNADPASRDPRLADFIRAHGDVESGVTQKWFETVEELEQAVRISMETWIRETFQGRPGGSEAVVVRDPGGFTALPRTLFGREELVASTLDMLTAPSQVLLQGGAGVGKTALANAVASRWIAEGRGEVLYLLAGSSEVDVLFDALARPFGLEKEVAALVGDARVHAVRRMLRHGGATLLVLDDAWNGAALHALLPAVPPEVALLVTSRQRFALEHLTEVPVLDPAAGVEMLRHHAGGREGEELGGLAEALAFLPFALEIAGRTLRMNAWTAARLMAQIASRAHEMKVPLDFRVEGRENVAALVETSVAALNPDARLVLSAFGALPQPTVTAELLSLLLSRRYEMEKAHGRMTGFPLPPMIVTEHVESDLEELIDAGFVSADPGSPTREVAFRIHLLTHSYVAANAGEGLRQRAVHAGLLLAEHYMNPSPVSFRALNPEVDNLVDLVFRAAEMGLLLEAEKLTALLDRGGKGFLRLQGYHRQAVALLERSVGSSFTRNEPGLLLDQTANLGMALKTVGRTDEALQVLGRALRLAEQAADGVAVAKCLNLTGVTHMQRDDPSAAADFFQRALQAARAAGDLETEAESAGNLAATHASLGLYGKAIEAYGVSERLTRELRDWHGMANDLSNIGLMFSHLGEFDRAIEHQHKALRIAREMGARMSEGVFMGNLGLAYAEAGRLAEAEESLRQAAEVSAEVGYRRGEAINLDELGRVYHRQGDTARALDCLDRAHGLMLAVGLTARASRVARLRHTVAAATAGGDARHGGESDR